MSASKHKYETYMIKLKERCELNICKDLTRRDLDWTGATDLFDEMFYLIVSNRS